MAAVVVDYESGDLLAACVRSLLADGAGPVVVVENGDAVAAGARLSSAGLAASVEMVVTGHNLGYGAGANRGIAATAGGGCPSSANVLVCNPDLHVHPGALARLTGALDAHPEWAIVGPRILDPAGDVYPSVRRFPSMADAAGHALLGVLRPGNRFTRRYRLAPAGERGDAGWVSGACFLARRSALEELGGFDESYFMFAEDMDLCWRAHRAGWAVGFEPSAVVTHTEGASRRRHPYRMVVAHHRSALRYASKTLRGWRRPAVPLAAAVLGTRLVAALVHEALRRS